jgi:heat shock protein HslJ
MVRLLTGFALVLSLSACDALTTPDDDDDDGFVGKTWQLVTLQESNKIPIVVPDPSKYEVTFGANGTVSGRVDCNQCGGPYTVNGSALDIGTLSCTLALCSGPGLDPKFTTALENALSVDVDEDELVIEGGGYTLRFREK